MVSVMWSCTVWLHVICNSTLKRSTSCICVGLHDPPSYLHWCEIVERHAHLYHLDKDGYMSTTHHLNKLKPFLEIIYLPKLLVKKSDLLDYVWGNVSLKCSCVIGNCQLLLLILRLPQNVIITSCHHLSPESLCLCILIILHKTQNNVKKI